MSLSLIHFGEVIFGGVKGIIDFLRRHGLLAHTADCGRLIDIREKRLNIHNIL